MCSDGVLERDENMGEDYGTERSKTEVGRLQAASSSRRIFALKLIGTYPQNGETGLP